MWLMKEFGRTCYEKCVYISMDENEVMQNVFRDAFEIKKTSNPGTELIKVFGLLDKSSTPRSKGAVICMKPTLSAIDRDNYIVPVWMI